jgi:hypothetical protein
MIRLKDNIQNAVMVPRILHVPNKNGSIDGLGQIALSAESCYQSITHVETGHLTKGFYNHDNIIMSH